MKLASWKGKLQSIGGKVTLLNSVISNLPIYQWSFFKMPSKVIKEIRAIQRKFLWKDVVEKGSVVWVKWDIVCKARKMGGLGVKYIGKFNKALLSKWLWRFLVEEGAIWSGVMKARYRDLRSRLWNCEGDWYDSKDLFWWRDLVAMCVNSRGILHNIYVKLGTDYVALFWNSHWLGRTYLSDLFPSLYQESVIQYDIVQNMGYWRGEVWCWKVIRAHEVLGQQASLELVELQTVLEDITLSSKFEDVIVWPLMIPNTTRG